MARDDERARQVVEACSGLRYLYPLIIMGILLSYFYREAWWKKVFLVVSAVPLTIFTNSFRIAMTGILYEVWGPAVAEGFFHGFSGWFIFMFGLVVLLAEMWALSGFNAFRAFKGLKGGEAGGEPGPVNEPEMKTNPDGGPDLSKNTERRSIFSPPQFIASVLLLGVNLAFAQGVEFNEDVPSAKAFSEFPLRVADWDGKREAMEEKFIRGLHLDDYVIVDFNDGSGKSVNFYTAYYESQRKGESIHSPETCLPGSGWEFRKAGTIQLPIRAKNGEPMRVNKALMVQGEARQLSYFWFPQRDRVLTNAWELKIFNFWDALTRQRTDGALVRLITPVYPGEAVDAADARLAAFTRDIVPVLNEFLP